MKMPTKHHTHAAQPKLKASSSLNPLFQTGYKTIKIGNKFKPPVGDSHMSLFLLDGTTDSADTSLILGEGEYTAQEVNLIKGKLYAVAADPNMRWTLSVTV